MAWIKTIPPDEATDELAEIYDEFMSQRKRLRRSPIMEVYSLKPALFRAARNFSHAVTFGGSSLGRRKEELIATVVATQVRCTY